MNNPDAVVVSTVIDPSTVMPPAGSDMVEVVDDRLKDVLAQLDTTDTEHAGEVAEPTSESGTEALEAPKKRKSKKAKAPKATKGGKAPKVVKGGKGSKGAKAKAKKERPAKPTTGQSAEEFQLPYANLNPKEKKVIDFLDGEGHGLRETRTIEQIAEECFHGKSDSKNVTSSAKRANSWARNSLRDLVPGGFAERVDRGKYKITEAGRKRRERALESAATGTE